MSTKRILKIIKDVAEAQHSQEADQETIEAYRSSVRRFIRPKAPTTKLISNNSVSADFSFADIVNVEQIDNPNIQTEDGTSSNKISTDLNSIFSNDDPIFDLDEDREILTQKKPKKMTIKTKKLNTRYKK